jgi:hypothetical protein
VLDKKLEKLLMVQRSLLGDDDSCDGGDDDRSDDGDDGSDSGTPTTATDLLIHYCTINNVFVIIVWLSVCSSRCWTT